MHILITKQVNAPAEKVWEVLWHNYNRSCDWASTVNHSEAREDLTESLGGRKCHSSYGEVSEIIDYVNDDEMNLKYHLDGTPAMIKSGKANWKVNPTGTDTSEIVMNLDVELALIPRLLMTWMIKPKMHKDMNQTVEDLKHFVETGKQTEAKKKSDAKFKKKKGNKAA
ncbi:SRPBCC family protein [Flagellimonas meridianipacifica]|uniref:Polyketide cyclase/dehydrase/lipid transport protein n=1 Tax=Flagellimonas meridianipacifica TaxID=1080225 RepID=A0A2T0M946_9FLAO|nr:SRPBCC family protein [Allomuricauda pacifica]PRX53993.1 polyketide cyclase/dehydrase/lipid transport protein [Allomuricauda pacifica]